MYFTKINKENDKYKKVVIQYNHKVSSRYSFKTYNKYPFLKNYITKEKFNNIIDKANIIIYDAKIKKEEYYQVKINNFTYILFLISLIFALAYILLIYYAPRTEHNRKIIKISGIVFFYLSIIILLFTEIFYILRKVQGDKPLIYFYKDDIISYLGRLNEIWKGKIIFNYDEITNNINCFIKNDEIINIALNNYNNIRISDDSSSLDTNKSFNKEDLYSDKNK